MNWPLVIALASAGAAVLVLRRLLRSAVLTGRVLDDEGHPLGGVVVGAVRRTANPPRDPVPDPEHVTLLGRRTADREGRFELTLPQGSWRLLAFDPRPDARVCAREVDVEARGGEIEPVEVRLGPGLWIEGTLAVDPGVESPGAVSITAVAGDESRELSCRGNEPFRLGPLAAGDYALTTTPASPLFARSGPMTVAAGTAGITIRIEPCAAELAGSVIGPDGGPAVARLELRRPGAIPVQGQSAADGRFALAPVEPGCWDLAVEGESGIAAAHGVDLRAGRRHELTLRLRPPATLAMRRPVGTGPAECVLLIGDREVWSGTVGETSRVVKVPAGELTIRVAIHGMTVDHRVRTRAGERLDVSLTEWSPRVPTDDRGDDSRSRNALF